MKTFAAVIAALCMLQMLDTVSVKSRRDSPTVPTPLSHLQELLSNATRTVQDLAAETQPAREQLVQTLQAQAQALATNLRATSAQLSEQAQAASGSLGEALTTAARNINATITNLQQEHPLAADIRASLQSGFDAVVAAATTVADNLQGPTDAIKETVANITTNALTRVQDLATEAKTQLHAATAPAH